MKVWELIDELKLLPPGANVKYVYDGCARADVEVVYFANGEYVVVSDVGEKVYDDKDRPMGAPTEQEEPYWETEEMLPPASRQAYIIRRGAKLRPVEWMKITGITVVDPDGWREDKKSLEDPICEDEWRRRITVSTCRYPLREVAKPRLSAVIN